MKVSLNHIKLLVLGLVLSLLQSCIQGQPSRGKRGGALLDSDEASKSRVGDDMSGDEGGSGSGGAPTDGGVGSDDDVDPDDLGRAEIRHIIDPFDGTYKTKLTIPKNFTGRLHLSGLNITSLNDKLVSVRFNFGRELEPVTIEATIGQAPGIIPQTDIEVLILDIQDKPFENIRLLYDLFDYKTYDTDDEPISDPRDPNLYCRGLKLEHDPSFLDDSDGKCDDANEKCLYSYAKIKDSTLEDDATGFLSTPTEPQIDIDGSGYVSDSVANALKKCLPDNNSRDNFNGVLNASVGTAPTYGSTLSLGGNSYTYRGPFRALAKSEWEIEDDALIGTNGLFASTIGSGVDGGITSFLFPRAGVLDLRKNVEHFASGSIAPSSKFDVRTLQNLSSAGDSTFVDGCNLRVTNFNEFNGEGLSSCNLTATIEIITVDQTTQSTEVLAVSEDVKLQLIRPSQTNFEGKEVLFESMKTCSSSRSCASDECCYNNRCWSKSLVAQCLEDANGEGNLGIGESCQSDYECASLCCDQSKGKCGVHDSSQDPPVLCAKSPGQQCVTQDFCRRENVVNCYIVRAGFDEQGNQICAKRCYNVPTFGRCRNGTCVPPASGCNPSFDPSSPSCPANAIDPPTTGNFPACQEDLSN